MDYYKKQFSAPLCVADSVRGITSSKVDEYNTKEHGVLEKKIHCGAGWNQACVSPEVSGVGCTMFVWSRAPRPPAFFLLALT